MSRYRGPKNKIARRFQANIFGRSRNPLLHKAAPTKRRKKSDYCLQLEEKQKLRAVYGMLTQKQLVRYYREAARRKGETAHNFIAMLECRLDNVVYKLRMANTIFAAQQLVSHGHICVNGKKVDIRSFQVRPGMKVSIKEKSREMTCIKNALDNSSREIPPFLSLDADKFEGTLLAIPLEEQIAFPLPLDVHFVCEFLAYST